jgi:hypothetical protein
VIFGYTVDQARKAVIAFIGGLILLVAMFVTFPIGFDEALGVVLAQGFAVLGVFLAKNHTPDDLTKALQQLAGGVVALVALFETVDPNTLETIIAIVGEFGLFYAVFHASNDPRANRNHPNPPEVIPCP